MKKFLSLIVVLSLVLSIMASAVTADATPALTIGEVSGKAGETVTVDFKISDMEIVGFGLTITYDATVMTLKQITVGETDFEMFMPNPKTGKVQAFNYMDTAKVGGVLLTATFQLLEDAASGEYAIGVKDVKFNDANEQVIDMTVNEGKVTVPAASAPTLTIGEASGKAGETVTVDFNISDMEIVGFGLTITYDATVMTLKQITVGETDFEMFMPNPKTGKVQAFNYMGAAKVGGVLLTATFQLLDDVAGGEYAIGVKDVKFNDANEQVIDMTVNEGKVTVPAASVPTLTIGEASGKAGETVTVDFNISDMEIVGFGLTITYDATVMTLKKITVGETEFEMFMPNPKTGKVQAFNYMDTAKVGGVLLSATFQLLEDAAGGEYAIGVKDVKFNDANEQVIDLTIVDGSVTIEAAPHTHEFGDVTYEWAADYSAYTATRACACGHTETAHATVTSKVTNPTCDDAGYTTYTATFAEEWAEDATKRVPGEPATGHTYGDVTYAWNADNTACTATRECACGHKETAHATVKRTESKPTCTEAGSVTYTATFAESWAATQTKTVAGAAATGHNYGTVAYSWNADNTACTATRECACGHKETAHATVKKTESKPTCTEDGSITYTATFSESWAATQTKTVAGAAATGHNYGEVTYAWNADNTACTATRECACGHSETANATVTSKVDGASCTEAGTITYTATFSESWAETQTKTVAGTTATGHIYGEVTYEWAADYSAYTATRQCACGHIETAHATVTSKVTDPTCTEAGYTTYTATFAEAWAKGDTKKVDGPAATGHSFGAATYAWSADNNACTATRECACGHKETAHATVKKTEVKPTCTEDGSITYTATFSESWATTQTKTVAGATATGHNYGAVTYSWSDDYSACTATHSCACGDTETAHATVKKTESKPTCTEDGSTTYTATFSEAWAETQTKTIAGAAATGHTFGVATYAWSADNNACTATRACACGHKETAHATVKKTEVKPTCTEDGSITYTATFSESWATTQTKTVAGAAATGHNYGAVSYSWSDDYSACTATRACACGHKETAHATVKKTESKPTCTEAGSTTYTATFSEAWAATQTKTIAGAAATGHTFGAATYAWSADNNACTATRACACGHKETAHATVKKTEVKPTCTEDGSITYTATFSVSWATTQTKTVAGAAATGHNYGAVTYSWSDDYSACTATHSCACGDTETAHATVKKTESKPTCTEAGSTTYTATFSEAWAATQTKTIAGAAATGHTFGDWTVSKAATCTEDGVETRTCHCGHSESRAIPATGHAYTDTVTAPTCTEKGFTTHTCACGHSYVDSYVDAIGHADADNNEVCDSCNADLTNAKTGDTVLAVIVAAVISLLSIVALPVIKKRL